LVSLSDITHKGENWQMVVSEKNIHWIPFIM